MPRRILVADSDPDIREVIGTGLIRAGYDVFSTDCGRSIVKTVANGGIDLVLLDIALLNSDGPAIGRRIREESGAGVVFLSGQIDTIDEIASLYCAADDYLTKPFQVHELITRVQRVLHRMVTEATLIA